MTDKVLQLVIGELQSKCDLIHISNRRTWLIYRMRDLLSNARYEKKHKVFAERGGTSLSPPEGHSADKQRDISTAISSDQPLGPKSFS